MNQVTEKSDSQFRVFPLILGLSLMAIGMGLLFFAYDQTYIFFFLFFFFGLEMMNRSNIYKFIIKLLKKK